MKKLFAIAMATALIGCGSEDLSEPQEEERYAIIYGRIIDTEGAPIANANVDAIAYETCTSTTSGGSESATTGANGNYRIRVEYPDGDRQCVVLRAWPPSQSLTLLGDTIEIPNVQFKAVPTDSIQRNITMFLRAPGGGNPGQ